MNFVPMPIVLSGEPRATAGRIRATLRQHVQDRGITILKSDGQKMEVDELLDEALGPEPKTPAGIPLIVLGLIALLAVRITIVLFFFPGR